MKELAGSDAVRIEGAFMTFTESAELGDARAVEPGDVATLVGPDHQAVHPNTVAERAGISVYDVLMRLSPLLPVRLTPA